MTTQRERTERAIAKRLARVQASISRHWRCCREPLQQRCCCEPLQQLLALRDPLWFRIDAMATQGLTTKEGYSAWVS